MFVSVVVKCWIDQQRSLRVRPEAIHNFMHHFKIENPKFLARF